MVASTGAAVARRPGGAGVPDPTRAAVALLYTRVSPSP
jgi:hypothetical protein